MTGFSSLMRRYVAPAVMAGLLIGVAIELSGAAADRLDMLKWFDPIQDVLLQLKNGYVDNLTADQYKAMQKGAIDGMLKTLNDPYTVYIPNEDQKNFDKEVRGIYAGIGAEVRIENGWMTIKTPMAGSPALAAGIQAGDQIRAIEGATTKGEDLNDSIKRLTGPPESQVRVTVHHEGDPDDKTEDLMVTRRSIHVATVEGVHRMGEDWDFWLDTRDKIGYIRLNQFTGTSPVEMHEALQGLVQGGMKGLVLDLRFDPGGSLQSAIEIADMFIDEGTIVSVGGRDPGDMHHFKATSAGTFPDFPMTVLVNNQSASASEILSGALSDSKRAVIVGTRTFGKGVVQDVRPLPSGEGQLKITTANYYLPSGRNLHKRPNSTTWGVDPTTGFFVPMTTEQYNTELKIENDLDVILPKGKQFEGNWDDPDWVLKKLDDPQLDAACKAVQIRLASGKWEPTGQVMKPTEPIIDDLKTAEKQRDLLEDQLAIVQKRLSSLYSLVPPEVSATEKMQFIPTGTDLTNGIVEVKDSTGKVVTTLKITDPGSMEFILHNLDVLVPVNADKGATPPAKDGQDSVSPSSLNDAGGTDKSGAPGDKH